MSEEKKGKGLIIAGYVVAFLSFFFMPIVFVFVGVILGIINIIKDETGHGIAQILLSIVLATIGASIGGWGFNL